MTDNDRPLSAEEIRLLKEHLTKIAATLPKKEKFMGGSGGTEFDLGIIRSSDKGGKNG